MKNKESLMTVIGAGSYGTALAIALSRNGSPVTLWGHNSKQMNHLEAIRENQYYLPGIRFPESLVIEADLATAVSHSDNILVVVPSHVFGDVLAQLKPFLTDKSRVCWATKGLEHDSGRLLQEVAESVIGKDHQLAVLSGPTFATELANGLPTAISVASPDISFAEELQEIIHCSKSFRVYINRDFTSVQLGGAIKNVIAIGAGISDGMGFGANARTALITRGLAEMCRLGVSLGSRPENFMGMAGLGDLVLTCTDDQSRNRRFGLALGKGKDVMKAQEEIGQVVEGYKNTKEVWLLAQRMKVDMPIVEQIYAVLYDNKEVEKAAKALLSREKGFEFLSN